MGNRISISFKNDTNSWKEESVALFSHWQGKDLLRQVEQYLTELKAKQTEAGNPQTYPLDRLEPNTVMVDFIRWLTQEETEIKSDLYLGKDGDDGDNSDNGHFTIDLNEKDIHDHIYNLLMED